MMNMHKIKHAYRDYNRTDNIRLNDVIEANIVNLGTETAYVNGVKLSQNDTYVFSNSNNLICNTTVAIAFAKTPENMRAGESNQLRLFVNIPLDIEGINPNY